MFIQKTKRKKFNVIFSVKEIEKYTPGLPNGECYKYITNGKFSSISFVKFIADRDPIINFYASTFRVGARETANMDFLHNAGKLGSAFFLIGKVMRNDKKIEKRYRYYQNFADTCSKNGWEYCISNNHSKVLLFECASGNKYVLETSSNLNDNPNIEQFSLEDDEELFDFYKTNIFREGKSWQEAGQVNTKLM